MARRGRKPKPTQLKILHGTRRDRVNTQEPDVPADRVAPPSWLEGDGLSKWHELVPQLVAAGVAKNLDIEALARYCWVWSQWRRHAQLCERGADLLVMRDEAGRIRYSQVAPSATLVTKYSGILARLESEFGLTPSSRSNLVVTDQPTNELDRWLRESPA